jgi:hypothetical protein
MTDPSTPEPIDGPPWPEWRGNAARRCVGHKKNGEQCRRHARQGTSVCDFHGAKAPQVKAKARQRLEEAADRMARELLNMASDGNVSDATKLAAIRDALDRAGVSAKQALELSTARQPEPWELLLADIAFDGIAQITREESRARRGLPSNEPFTPPTREIEVLEGELVPEPLAEGGFERAAHSPFEALLGLDRADLPADDSSASTASLAAPPTSLSYEEAADVMRSSRLRTNLGRSRGRGR